MVEHIDPKARVFRIPGAIDDQQLPNSVHANTAQYRDVGRYTTRLTFGLHDGNNVAVPRPEAPRPAGHVANSLKELVEEGAIAQVDPDHEWEKLNRLTDRSKKAKFLQAIGLSEADYLVLPDVQKKRLIWQHLFIPNKKSARMFDIAPSTKNRPDITATVSLEGNLSRHNGNPALTTEHTFNHNSPFNGKKYRDAQGNVIAISSAIAASQDRYTPNAKMSRRVRIGGKTILHTSPPENYDKALEHTKWIIQQELSTPEDLRRSLKKNPDGSYDYVWVVDSLLSPGQLLSAKEANKNRREDMVLAAERRAFERLRYDGTNAIQVPDAKGKMHTVRLRPILIDQVFNMSHNAMQALPSMLGGAETEREIAQKGLEELINYAKQYEPDPDLDSADRAHKQTTIKNAISYADPAKFHDYLPEQKVLALLLLCEAVELSLLVHCMSSKDRTGICIALASALAQYKALFGQLPAKYSKESNGETYVCYHELLREEKFRELFAANLMVGHNVSRCGRGAEGELNGEELEEHLGLELNANPPVCRLLPDRYVKKIGAAKKAAITVGIYLGVIVVLPILVGLYIGLTAGTLGAINLSSKVRKLGSILLVTFLLTYAAMIKSVLVLLLDGTLSLLHIANHKETSTDWYYWRSALRDLQRCLSLYKLADAFDITLDKKSPYLAGRHLIKEKEKHPFVPRVQKVVDWLKALPEERAKTLVALLKAEHPNAADLTPDEKTMLLTIGSDLDLWKEVLSNKFLKNRLAAPSLKSFLVRIIFGKNLARLPKYSNRLLLAALDWKLFKFATADRDHDATRKWIGDFFQDSGDWTLPNLPNPIPSCVKGFTNPDGSYNVAALNHRIARETGPSRNHVYIDGVLVTNHDAAVEANLRGQQNCQAIREALRQKRIHADEINRMLCCLQIQALVETEMRFRDSFFIRNQAFETFGLFQDEQTPPEFRLATRGAEGPVLTIDTYYVFASQRELPPPQYGRVRTPRQRATFTTTINLKTGKTSLKFNTVRHPDAPAEAPPAA